MRNGFEIDVHRQMLPPFKESFFDGIYFKGFPVERSWGDSPVVIDVGANVGFFSLTVFSEYAKAKVIGFEPMPFNFHRLEAYREQYPSLDWSVENRAVAHHGDGLTLYSSTLDGFSTMAGVFASGNRAEKIEVSTCTIAEVMKKYRLERIDLLKLDCEGSEYAILYYLHDHHFRQISHFSIETHKGSAGKEDHDALVNFLKDKGLHLCEEKHGDTGYIWAWR